MKGKQRMAEMDAEQNAKKSSWQTFQTKVRQCMLPVSKTELKAPRTNLLTPKYDGLLTTFAFKFNLRRYTKVGGKKKAGFVSKKVGSTKESIFSIPQGVGSRVGVTGSGKGITDFERKRRHEYDN